jgi:hypothetical protein
MVRDRVVLRLMQDGFCSAAADQRRCRRVTVCKEGSECSSVFGWGDSYSLLRPLRLLFLLRSFDGPADTVSPVAPRAAG